ncbi:MAG: hypothetical protein J2P57_19435 [Acidimicrobiaceae bacterium]|nr:hypothetical protein [Acidimicrobiaceae bacterium]
MPLRMYRPDGEIGEPGRRLAPPRWGLSGARIGVLDNCKPNAGVLMTHVAEVLSGRAGGPRPLVLEKNAAQPAPAAVLAQLEQGADLVLTGSAD